MVNMNADKVVLIVDDDQAVLETMQLLLQGKGGFAVYCAVGTTGAAACLDARARVDVIVADMILAGKSTGVDICDMGRRLHPQVGLVVISADPFADVMALPERSVFLRKPFGGNELIEAIGQALVLARGSPLSGQQQST
jgi:CheY-like chemotaxis protein